MTRAKAKDAYKAIQERVLAFIEEEGTTPWRKPWKGSGAGYAWPSNADSGRPYRGINVVLLGMAGYDWPLFMTFKQALKREMPVMRGEKGHRVIFWNWKEVESKKTGKKEMIPFLRTYTVFNIDQLDGGEAMIPEQDESDDLEFVPQAEAERIVEGYQERGGPEVIHRGSRACYSPERDKIRLPAPERFESVAAYYSTLFHELGHSTGHPSRIARTGVCDPIVFGSHTYGKEELVAELTAAFLCWTSGIQQPEVEENSAAYLKSWIGKIQEDPKLIVLAAAQAQKATDLILNQHQKETTNAS